MLPAIGHTSSVRQAAGSRQMDLDYHWGHEPAALLPLEEALQRLAGAFPPAGDRARSWPTGTIRPWTAAPWTAPPCAAPTAPRRARSLGTLYAGDPPGPVPAGPGHLRADHDRGLPARRGPTRWCRWRTCRRTDGRLSAPGSPPGRAMHPPPGRPGPGRGAAAAGRERPRNAARAGLRAQVGLAAQPLARVRVGIAPTGDEIVDRPAPHQIRDSNGPMLAALAHALGAEVRLLPPIPDDPERAAGLPGRPWATWRSWSPPAASRPAKRTTCPGSWRPWAPGCCSTGSA